MACLAPNDKTALTSSPAIITVNHYSVVQRELCRFIRHLGSGIAMDELARPLLNGAQGAKSGDHIRV